MIESVLDQRIHVPTKKISDVMMFANLCIECQFNPGDLAELLMILRQKVYYGVQFSNEGTDYHNDKCDQYMNEFNHLATKMGITDIQWDSFFPTARKGKVNIIAWPVGRQIKMT